MKVSIIGAGAMGGALAEGLLERSREHLDCQFQIHRKVRSICWHLRERRPAMTTGCV